MANNIEAKANTLNRYAANVVLIASNLEMVNKGNELYIVVNSSSLKADIKTSITNIEEYITTFADNGEDTTVVLISEVTDNVFSKKVKCNNGTPNSLGSEIKDFIISLFKEVDAMEVF